VTGIAAANLDGRRGEQSLQGRKVLVVDDETDSRTLLAEVLELEGMQVTTAGSADEAIAAMDTSVPDLLLSDIGMPIKDGFTLIEKVRRRSAERGGKVLASALTGYGSEADRERAQKAGFQSVIVKPFDADEIVAHIRSLLNSHAG
jgi:CheY-like chemotaxis protein